MAQGLHLDSVKQMAMVLFLNGSIDDFQILGQLDWKKELHCRLAVHLGLVQREGLKVPCQLWFHHRFLLRNTNEQNHFIN